MSIRTPAGGLEVGGMTHQIITGEAIEVMRSLPPASADVCITDPVWPTCPDDMLAGAATATRATYMAELVAQVCTGVMEEFDFKAMDVCSMGVIIPEFAKVLGDHPDPYTRIKEAAHLSTARDVVKLNFLTWAYGGKVDPSLQIVFEQDQIVNTGITGGGGTMAK